MASFYKEVKDSVIATLDNNQEIYFYVPENYFQTKSAIIIGEFVSILGIFYYGIYKNGKLEGKLKTFYFPSVFLTQPNNIEKVKDIQLDNGDPSDYRILKYKNSDKLIVSTKVPQDIQNVEEFFRLFLISGKIPNSVDYRYIWKYMIENMELSGNSFNINMQLFGIFQSELCRDIDDTSRPFRLSKAKKAGEWYNYKSVSVKEIPKYTSPYVNITSEGFDDSIIAATMMDKAKFSPLERVLSGRHDS